MILYHRVVGGVRIAITPKFLVWEYLFGLTKNVRNQTYGAYGFRLAILLRTVKVLGWANRRIS